MDSTTPRARSWEEIQPHLTSLRLAVWQGYHQHGPCTTAQLAAATGLNILTIRPRTHELYHVLGLLDLRDEGQRKGEDGIYRAVSKAECIRRLTEPAPSETQIPLL